jgi:hypothetical protein
MAGEFRVNVSSATMRQPSHLAYDRGLRSALSSPLQSNVTLPDGSPYNYTVAQSSWAGGKGDVVDLYVQSSKKAGLPFGFYLTWVRGVPGYRWLIRRQRCAVLYLIAPPPPWQNYNYLFNYGPNGFAPGPLQPGQISVTAAEYTAIATAGIREVWARYPGAIYEVN